MSARVQSILALSIVALTIAAFVRRWLARRHKPGCGESCGCPSQQLKKH